MSRAIRSRRGLSYVLALLVGAGCSGGGGSGDPEADLILLARLFKGQISLANVAAYELSANGVKGRMLDEGQTDSDGNIRLNLSTPDSGFVLLAGWGGVVNDPFSGNTITIPATDPLCAIVDTNGDLSLRYQINPFTTWVSKRTEEEARRADTDLAQAYRNSDLAIRYKFGLGNEIATIDVRDLLQTQSAVDDGTELGFLDVAICEYAAKNSLNPFEVGNKLGVDMRDGLLDGAYRGTPVRWSTGSPLPVNIWEDALPQAIDNFNLNMSFNVNGYDANDTAVDEALASGIGLRFAPGSLRIEPRYVVKGGTTTFDIWGDGLPDLGAARLNLGGFDVDATDITDNGQGGYRVELDSSFADQLTYGVKVRYDLRIEDGDSGLSTTAESAFGSIQNDVAPEIDSAGLDWKYQFGSGGGVFRVHGWNFKPDTEFYVGSEPATVVDASYPNVALIVLPELAEGSYALRAEDGGGTDSVAGAVEARDKGATTVMAGDDLRPEIGFGVRYGFDGEFSTSTFDFRTTYTDAGTGSFVYNGIESSEGSPSLRTFTYSGSAYGDDRGLEKDVLLDAPANSYQLFYRQSWAGDYSVGHGPNTTLFTMRQPTSDVGESTFAGDYNASIQMWSFATGEWRQMTGNLFADDNGFIYLNVNCLEMHVDGSDNTNVPISVQLEYELGSLGRITYRSLTPGFAFDATGQVGADGRVQAFRGTLGTDWQVYGVAGRRPAPGEADPVGYSGSYRGSQANLRIDAGAIEGVFNRTNTALEYFDGQLGGTTIDEGVDSDAIHPDGKFRWGVRYPTREYSIDGRWADEDNDLAGFFVAGGDLSIGYSTSGTGTSFDVRLPSVRSVYGLEGDHYYGVQSHINFDDVDNTFTTVSQLGRLRYESPNLSGFKFDTTYQDLGNETKYTNRLADGTVEAFSVSDFDLALSTRVTTVFDQSFKVVTQVNDAQSPYAGVSVPFVYGSGKQSGDTHLWGNYGTPGPQYFVLESRIPDTPATSMPQADFRLVGIGNEYVGNELRWNALKAGASYDSGGATISGDWRTKFQDTSAANSTLNLTGSVPSFDSNGIFTQTDSDGQTYRGFLLGNGEGFFRVNLTDNTRQGLGFGVQETTSAPKICDQFGFQFIYGFDAVNKPFVTLVPVTNMFTVPDAERGTGTFFYQGSNGSDPSPFAFFSDNIGSANATGGFQYQDKYGTASGGLSSYSGFGAQAAGREGDPLDRIYARVTLDF